MSPLPERKDDHNNIDDDEIIHMGSSHLVRRSLRGNTVMAVKSLLDSTEDVSMLYNEYNILKRQLSSCKRVRKALRRDTPRGIHTVYLEWADGVTLAEWKQNSSAGEGGRAGRTVKEKVRVALGIARALDEIHTAGVAHCNIASDNIIVNGYDVVIIDFGYASLLSSHEYDDEGQVALDDLCSLGSVLEGLFSDQPLSSGRRDSMQFGGSEVISSHELGMPLSRRSVVGSALRGSVPQCIFEMISNLMETGLGSVASHPYTSAREVADDMEQFLENSEIFLIDPLEEDEFAGRLAFSSSKLYGRAKGEAALLDAYNRISDANGGQSEMFLVAGVAGIGKSSLVNQVHSLLRKRGGYFLYGKYDQLQRAQPFSAITAALTEFVELILAQNQESVQRMKGVIMDAVGAQGKVLTSIVPALTKIIGEQPEVANVSGIEAQNRTNFVFRLFTRSISRPDHPVVIFLDDLQWADGPSLGLMKALVTDSENKSILFVGCYRDNEVSPAHPFVVQLREIEKMEVPMTKLELGNLDKATANHLVADALRMSRRLTGSLTDIVHKKTLGNPFFTVHFLKSLVDEGLLVYSFQSERWQWDEEEVDGKNITDNVVELMADKMLKLKVQSQSVLKLASCLGSPFYESMLCLVIDTPLSEKVPRKGKEEMVSRLLNGHDGLVPTLNELVDEGLIFKTRWKASQYKFAHDRIQQAAYSLLTNDERAFLHLHIGHQLIENLYDSELECSLFLAVDQLNRGSSLVVGEKDKIELARLNQRAGEKSIQSSAFLSAASYLKAGKDALDRERHWESHYDLSLQLTSLLADTEYYNGNFDKMKAAVEEVLSQAKSFEDKFSVYSCLIKSLGAQGRLKEACEKGFEVLAQLGEPFPKVITKRTIILDLIKTKLKLMGKSEKSLCSLPEMENRMKRDAMEVLCNLMGYTYIGYPEAFPLVVFRMMRLFVKYGASDESAFAAASYGVILCGVLGDIRGGYRFAQLSLALLKRFDTKEWNAHVTATVYYLIIHWKEPIHSTLDVFQYSYHRGMEAGDIEFAMYSLMDYSTHAFQGGLPLEPLEEDTKAYCRQMVEYRQEPALGFMLPIRQTILNLLGRSDDPLRLSGDAMDESQMVKECKETGNDVVVALIFVHRLWLAYIFDNFELAAEMADKSRNIGQVAPGMFAVLNHTFFDTLTTLMLARRKQLKKWKAKVHRAIKKMLKWSRDSPENCWHKLLLLQAEKAAVQGKKDTLKVYDEAITAAKKSGFLHDEAISYERAGSFLKDAGDLTEASRYLSRAHQLYILWGAQAKADQFQSTFSALLPQAQRRSSFQRFLSERCSTRGSLSVTISTLDTKR